MGNSLDAKHTFAFAIDLEGQLAAVELEDRQIHRQVSQRLLPEPGFAGLSRLGQVADSTLTHRLRPLPLGDRDGPKELLSRPH
jgi:hypothetical protein